MKRANKKKLAILGIVIVIYLLVLTPLFIISVKNRSETRGRAQVTDTATSSGSAQRANEPAASCGNVTTDTILIIDRSGSMSYYNKLISAKQAAKNFIDVLAKDSNNNNRIGLVSFSTDATLNIALTSDFNAVKSKIDTLATGGNTCQECGVKKANAEIATHGRAGVKKVIVMLTDGQANRTEGSTTTVETKLAEEKALAAVKSGFSASGTSFYPIGLGDPDGSGQAIFYGPDFLKNVATLTGGKYYFPLPSELNGVYQEISILIGKGLTGGFVFFDANANGAFDSGEQKFGNWPVKLSSSTFNKQLLSDGTGAFSFSGLCDGTYQLSTTAQPGYIQSVPSNLNGYSINITNGSSYTDRNFGQRKPYCSDGKDNDNNGFADAKDSSCHTDGNPNNPSSYDVNKDGEKGGGNTCADSKDNNGNNLIDGADPVCHTDNNAGNASSYDPNRPEVNPPTPTVTPKLATTLTLDVLLDGIGSRGDNTNPTGNEYSNKNPQHKSKSADILMYNISNQLVAQGQGIINYSSPSGNFTGKVSVGTNFPTGKYYLKVKTAGHLRKIIPGIQTVTAGQENKLAQVALVTGDIDDNNSLNILDYNLLLDCYSDLSFAPNCEAASKKTASDLNDDNSVNQVDYNLFLREISTQPGE